MIPAATDVFAATDRGPRVLDELIADWNDITVELDGRTIVLPAQSPSEEVVFNIVLPLQETTPRTVALARLWAASLLESRLQSSTLQERIDELGAELTVRVSAQSVVLSGSSPHASLSAALDAVHHATLGLGPAPERLKAKARELAEQHLLYWHKIEVRAQSLARRAVFGPGAPLPTPAMHQELVGLSSADVAEYRSRRTDPGWLVVDAAHAPRWPEPERREPSSRNPFHAAPPANQVSPIVETHPAQGLTALAFASALHPDLARHCETWLASTVLGGYFASRLWERLRADHSRAYSPRSLLEHTAAGTNVLVTTTVTSQDLPATLHVLREELTRLGHHGPDGPELDAAKNYLLGSLLRSASGGRRLSSLIATWLARGASLEDLVSSAARIRGVTPAEVALAARSTLAPSAMSLAVCGSFPVDTTTTSSTNRGGSDD